MKAYRVTLALFEREDIDYSWEVSHGDTVQILTVAEDVSSASEFVAEAYMENDNTDRDEYEWQTVTVERLPEQVLLPPFPKGVPSGNEK